MSIIPGTSSAPVSWAGAAVVDSDEVIWVRRAEGTLSVVIIEHFAADGVPVVFFPDLGAAFLAMDVFEAGVFGVIVFGAECAAIFLPVDLESGIEARVGLTWMPY
jgi:hypothetical protein